MISAPVTSRSRPTTDSDASFSGARASTRSTGSRYPGPPPTFGYPAVHPDRRLRRGQRDLDGHDRRHARSHRPADGRRHGRGQGRPPRPTCVGGRAGTPRDATSDDVDVRGDPDRDRRDEGDRAPLPRLATASTPRRTAACSLVRRASGAREHRRDRRLPERQPRASGRRAWSTTPTSGRTSTAT